MAKNGINIESQTRQIIKDVKEGIFKPVYLLMGDEPYYPDMVCQAIIDNCLQDWEKDFNQTICYGLDVDADMVISTARRYPMMADRQLVVVKEAQQMKDLEDLAMYCSNPLDSTVLVILMHRASADKRKSFYKSVQKIGVVLESPAVRDYEITNWIISYYTSRGLAISPDAAQLLGESAGTDLSTIIAETDKLLKNLPEGSTRVTSEDVERNVGISRQFNIFELTKELSYRNAAKAVKIATYIGNSAKFSLPAAVSALFTHFYRVLKFEALLMSNPNPDVAERSRVLGVNSYFFRDYEAAVRNYPYPKCMSVIGLLNEYDFKGKGGDISSETPAGTLLIELVTKILSLE